MSTALPNPRIGGSTPEELLELPEQGGGNAGVSEFEIYDLYILVQLISRCRVLKG